MNHLTKLSAGIVTALFLASCSSGGSSVENHNSNSPKQLPGAGGSTADTPKPKLDTKPEATTNESGKYLKIVASNGTEKATTGSINSSSLEKVVVDGKTIQISYPGIYAGTWTKINNNISCCGKTNNSKIGYNSDTPAMSYMFFTGNVTPEMPNSGIAEYNGQFLYRGANTPKGIPVQGTANYKADFVNKKFEGALKADSVSVDIQADIDGNKITGAAKSSLDSSKGIVSGGFYGPNAAEVAGMIEGTNAGKTQWTSVFNGKK